MRRYFYLSLFLAVALLISCQQNDHIVPDVPEEAENIGNYIPGKVRLMVSAELADRIEAGETDLVAGTTLSRTFPHGGRYEGRMRKAGLHLWYDAEFDESIPLTRAGNDLNRLDGVEFIEYLPVPVSFSETPLFDDPDLRKQWHYINAGNVLTGLKAGSDINVLPAWERGVVGKDNVIVAVIDSGVDYTHEDLASNIWEGRDSLGKVIHGYNFIRNSNQIIPEFHGTHVAGTVAAVNNNGIGVAGIAGGDAANGIKGARIMSCQIFDGDDNGDSAAALVWAANNGAVIAQNSWGYPVEQNPDMKDTPNYMKMAIDYFNTYAGCDENGEQLPDSPMKGGVVFFSAGNEAISVGYPASYEGCIAVSGISGDYELAYYSNYGDWVDIAAPGGDAMKNQNVFSTIPDNAYDYSQGTSMACPHVSGVAALILSEFGGPGYSREDLIDRLLKTASDILLPADEMGAGMVNASAAVAHYGEFLPDMPEFAGFEQVPGSPLLLKYIMPEDNNGVECRKIDLIYSTSPFEEDGESYDRISKSMGRVSPGDTVTFAIEKLPVNTTYYFSAIGYDAYGNASEMPDNEEITTLDNLEPVIDALDGKEHVFKQYMQVRLKFRITDPEDELKEVRYENATDYDVFTQDDDVYVLSVDAQKIVPGAYESRIIAEDQFGKTAECVIKFTVEKNQSPKAYATIPEVLFTSRSGSRTINLSEYITDEDGETLTYVVKSSSESVVRASVARDVLTLNSTGYGEATVNVKATDALGDYVSASFRVVVRDASRPYDLYPNPVKDGKLYIRSSKKEHIEVEIKGQSGSIVYEGNLEADPFAPAVADITNALPGVYNVSISTGSGEVYTQNIVKL